jgi:hypothetical protein
LFSCMGWAFAAGAGPWASRVFSWRGMMLACRFLGWRLAGVGRLGAICCDWGL